MVLGQRQNIQARSGYPDRQTALRSYFVDSRVTSEELTNSYQLTGNSQPNAGGLRVTKQLPHVLYIIDQIRQLGGAERVLIEIVQQLSRHRFRCSIVTFGVERSLEALKNVTCPLHVFPLRRTYDFQAIKTALQLRALIRAENVSIVHTFFETSDLWAAPIAKLSGRPVLISSRRDMGILRTRKHQLAYPFVNHIFDRVLAVSDEVRSYAINHDHLPPGKVETLYNGVALEELDWKTKEFDARERLALPPNVPLVSLLANIRPVKGMDVLLRSAALVCHHFPTAVFVVAGSVLAPEAFSELQELVTSLGLQNNVNFVGHMPNPYPLVAASNVFCLPSRSEGFSNALIEAMACGLPCVATDVGGNAEALQDGQQGYIIASEDYQALAERTLRLLRDPRLAKEMGLAGRKRVIERFTVNAMMTRLMQIYDDLLEAKNG
jgi:glycosyltransferase involved in cell wall biosynthesis